ncbi:uncharacterized protein [Arachis hypogaea]|uniref:uncharacterized protein n=1 Tax=Arachis hypogaea TaxID=3818 RepID=UPI003B2137E6
MFAALESHTQAYALLISLKSIMLHSHSTQLKRASSSLLPRASSFAAATAACVASPHRTSFNHIQLESIQQWSSWLPLPPESRHRPPLAPFPTPSLHTPLPILLPEPPPRPHALLLLLWPPSAFFFHLFATVSNIVIREILLGVTTRLPRTTLHGYKELGRNFAEHTLLVRSTSAGRLAVLVRSTAALDMLQEENEVILERINYICCFLGPLLLVWR